VALGRRSLASAKARGNPAFSDEDEENKGDLIKEPPLSSSHKLAASVGEAHCSRSAWTSDLTGAVNQSNILHWNSLMGTTQQRYKNPTARRLETFPANAVTTGDAQNASSPPATPMNPPRSHSGAKRATAPAPLSTSQKPRQIEPADDSGAAEFQRI
jgi:hypothetical protein